MTQTPPKDKPTDPPDDTVKELVEAVAAAYFGACRKIARLVNRRRKRS